MSQSGEQVNATGVIGHESFLGDIEIQANNITVPLGMVSQLRTQHDQTVVVGAADGSVTLQNRASSSSDVSSILESSMVLRTTPAGIDVVL